jgi:hypothetical protein
MRKSESIGKISEALAKAQGQMKNASFDAVNPHYKSKYASLSSIMSACREALSQNSISIIQSPSFEEGRLIITTLLTHSSGEWIEDSLSMKVGKDTPQGVGSTLTYARRYSLSSMVGIVSDEDDDGESAQPDRSSKKTKPALKTVQAKIEKPKKLTKAQQAQTDRVQKIRQIFTLSAKLGHTPELMKEAIGNIIGLQRPIKESAEIKDEDLDLVVNTFKQQLELNKQEAA